MTLDSDLRDALEDLLDRERETLLRGDLDQFARLSEEKERLFSRLQTLPRVNLETLHGKALRNQELLDSALEGIRAVANRLQALRTARQSLETYDRGGKRQSIDGMTRPKVEKRA